MRTSSFLRVVLIGAVSSLAVASIARADSYDLAATGLSASFTPDILGGGGNIVVTGSAGTFRLDETAPVAQNLWPGPQPGNVSLNIHVTPVVDPLYQFQVDVLNTPFDASAGPNDVTLSSLAGSPMVVELMGSTVITLPGAFFNGAPITNGYILLDGFDLLGGAISNKKIIADVNFDAAVPLPNTLVGGGFLFLTCATVQHLRKSRGKIALV